MPDYGKGIRKLVDDLSVGSKLASDSRVTKAISDNLDSIESINPALAAKVRAGDPKATLEAYRMVIGNSGSVPARKIELPVPKAVDPAPYGPGIADQFDAAIGRQPQGMELGSDLWRRMDKSAGAYDNILKGRTANLRNQNPELVRVRADDMRTKNARAADSRAPSNPAFHARNLYSGAVNSGLPKKALAAGAAAGVGLALRNLPPEPSAQTADLVEEQRPAPKVYATPDLVSQMPSADMMLADVGAPPPKVLTDSGPPAGPVDYSAQAKAIIEKLNAMRRAAGGEVPEAPAMMREIQRLLDLSNQQRNAPDYQPRTESGDPGEEAIALLQDLNRRRMEAGGEVPDSAQVLRRVAQLQAASDKRKWG